MKQLKKELKTIIEPIKERSDILLKKLDLLERKSKALKDFVKVKYQEPYKELNLIITNYINEESDLTKNININVFSDSFIKNISNKDIDIKRFTKFLETEAKRTIKRINLDIDYIYDLSLTKPLEQIDLLISKLKEFYSNFDTKNTSDGVKNFQKNQLATIKEYKSIILGIYNQKSYVVKNTKNINTKIIQGAKKNLDKMTIESFYSIINIIQKEVSREINKVEEKIYYIKAVEEIKKGSSKIFDELYIKIHPIVEKYARKYSYGNTELYDDLYQSGSISILKGIQNFSVEKSDNFINYIKTRIVQGIFNYLTNKEATIRLPVHIKQILNKISNLMLDNDFMNSVDNNLTERLAEELEEKEHIIEKALKYVSENKVVNFSALEGENNEGDKLNFENTLSDESMNITGSMVKNEELDTLKRIITSVLTEEEQKILVYRYGLFGHKPLLLKDLGKKLNKSEERIRQIEGRVIRKLSVKYFDKNFVNKFCHI